MLCRTADPIDLVHTLHVERHFPLIYMADLDAIQQLGDHAALLARINDLFPELHLWFDGGFQTPADLTRIGRLSRVRAVIGSESWTDRHACPTEGSLLSIDCDAQGPRDPSGICGDPVRRPHDLILMNLGRVGSRQGPDADLLEEWRNQAPGARLYLAGGIRGIDDVVAAHSAGAQGVLTASALHDGSLDGVAPGIFT